MSGIHPGRRVSAPEHLLRETERGSHEELRPRTFRLVAKGERTTIRYVLARVSSGLYVEREEIPERGLRTVLSMLFDCTGAFERWHDTDPVKFSHPLVHIDLKREADRLWLLPCRDVEQ
jgi:hypothetical protein